MGLPTEDIAPRPAHSERNVKPTSFDELVQQLPSADGGHHPAELNVPLVRSLFEAAQSGYARQVAQTCQSWCQDLPKTEKQVRFWLLAVRLFCAQTEALDLDQSAIAAELVEVAIATKIPDAEAAARAARALWLATQGRHTLGLFDLSRAAVLLEDPSVIGRADASLNGLYLRQFACNTLALALMRQEINDQALLWLRRCREVALSHPDGASGVFLSSFNEAWVHLTTGFALDMAERPSEATTRYARAAHCFDSAIAHDRQWAATSALAPSASLLSIAASVLQGTFQSTGHLRSMLAVTKYTRPDHLAVCLLALAHGRYREGNDQEAMAILESARSALPSDHSFRSILGRILWEESLLSTRKQVGEPTDAHNQRLLRFLIQDQQEERAARLCAYQDWMELEQQRRRLVADQGLALIDDLTGLLNRRALDTVLREALDAAAASGDTAMLVFIDLDDFKVVNDEMSHQVGDTVLQLFAEQVRAIIEPADVVVRYGGDEFVLLLVGRTAELVQQEMHLLQHHFATCTAAHPQVGHAVTFSAGVVTATPDDNVERLLVRADHAMLNGKRSGRNIILFDRRTDT